MGRDQTNTFGPLLRTWRKARSRSQLDLALDAEVSARHISFLETGRAKPSRQMVLRLGDQLEVPLRAQNELLVAAGFAPAYPVRGLDDDGLAPVRGALERLLQAHEPWGACLLDRHWRVRLANRALTRIVRISMGDDHVMEGWNIMLALFDEAQLKPAIENFDEVAFAMWHRLDREASDPSADDETRALLDEINALYTPNKAPEAASPLLSLQLAAAGMTLSLHTAITTLGTPHDVTLQELRLETYFPADDASAELLRALAA